MIYHAFKDCSHRSLANWNNLTSGSICMGISGSGTNFPRTTASLTNWSTGPNSALLQSPSAMSLDVAIGFAHSSQGGIKEIGWSRPLMLASNLFHWYIYIYIYYTCIYMYIKTKIYTTYIYIMTQIYIYISMEQYIGSPNGYFVKDRYFIGIYYQQYQGTICF